MSSSRNMPDDTNFLKTTNPEVFKIHPRPGGYVPLPNESKSETKILDEELKAQLDEKISKEFRVQTALEETQSFYSDDVTIPNPVKDAMYSFGVTISTLMMLASNQSNISQDYLDWTTHCLECVRDDFGNHPPNVQGILNHIKTLKPGEEPPPPPPEEAAPEEDENAEQTIRTTTTVKIGEEEEETEA